MYLYVATAKWNAANEADEELPVVVFIFRCSSRFRIITGTMIFFGISFKKEFLIASKKEKMMAWPDRSSSQWRRWDEKCRSSLKNSNPIVSTGLSRVGPDDVSCLRWAILSKILKSRVDKFTIQLHWSGSSYMTIIARDKRTIHSGQAMLLVMVATSKRWFVLKYAAERNVLIASYVVLVVR